MKLSEMVPSTEELCFQIEEAHEIPNLENKYRPAPGHGDEKFQYIWDKETFLQAWYLLGGTSYL